MIAFSPSQCGWKSSTQLTIRFQSFYLFFSFAKKKIPKWEDSKIATVFPRLDVYILRHTMLLLGKIPRLIVLTCWH